MSNMNWLDKAVASISPTRGLRRAQARQMMNVLAGYDAAGKGRRWFRGSGTSQNAEMRKGLIAMRNAARELERNNPYVASAIQVVTNLTIGAGIRPKAKHPTDKKKRQLADDLMEDWYNSVACDYEGQNHGYGLQSLAMRTETLSGESLTVRRITNDRNLPVPLQIQILEGDFLDETKDSYGLQDELVQGVEFRNGKRANYWLRDRHPGDRGGAGYTSRPTPASQVAHMYELHRPGQVRGVPRGIASYTRLKNLDDFQDARVEQQIWAACLVGFIQNEMGEGTGDVLPDKMEPGIMPRLKPGESINFNNPPQVSGHDSFVMPEQRIIAACWGITYEALTGDYSGVNFSSGKMGRIQMYANIHNWRKNMVIPKHCDRIGKWFNEAAALRGYDLDGVTWDWVPPRREILDPKNELPPIIQEVRSGLSSWQSACRERGIDPKKLAEEIKEDNELFDSYGFVLDTDPRRVTNNGQMHQQGNYPAPASSDSSQGETE